MWEDCLKHVNSMQEVDKKRDNNIRDITINILI